MSPQNGQLILNSVGNARLSARPCRSSKRRPKPLIRFPLQMFYIFNQDQEPAGTEYRLTSLPTELQIKIWSQLEIVDIACLTLASKHLAHHQFQVHGYYYWWYAIFENGAPSWDHVSLMGRLAKGWMGDNLRLCECCSVFRPLSRTYWVNQMFDGVRDLDNDGHLPGWKWREAYKNGVYGYVIEYWRRTKTHACPWCFVRHDYQRFFLAYGNQDRAEAIKLLLKRMPQPKKYSLIYLDQYVYETGFWPAEFEIENPEEDYPEDQKRRRRYGTAWRQVACDLTGAAQTFDSYKWCRSCRIRSLFSDPRVCRQKETANGFAYVDCHPRTTRAIKSAQKISPGQTRDQIVHSTLSLLSRKHHIH